MSLQTLRCKRESNSSHLVLVWLLSLTQITELNSPKHLKYRQLSSFNIFLINRQNFSAKFHQCKVRVVLKNFKSIIQVSLPTRTHIIQTANMKKSRKKVSIGLEALDKLSSHR